MLQRTCLFASLVFVGACKVSSRSSLAEGEQATTENVTIAVRDELPSQLRLFTEVLSGKATRMHDYYFTVELPKHLSDIAKMSNEVVMEFTETVNYGEGVVDMPGKHYYRGIEIGSRILVFRKSTAAGGVSERGPWWTPFRSYPSTLVAKRSLEERIKFGLDTDIYEKQRLGQQMETLDAIEFLFHFIPAYGGAKKFFYENEKMGLVWMIGDVASLGMMAKANALANVSRGVVIGAATVRIGNDISKAAQGTFTTADGIDAALATVEGGLAIFGFANLKVPRGSGGPAKNIDELIDSMGSERIFMGDRASASVLAKRLGREVDDIMQTGITREELAKIANKKILDRVESATSGRVFNGSAAKTASQVIEGIDLTRVNNSLRKIENGTALTFEEAMEISGLALNDGTNKLLWNVQKNLGVIYAEENLVNRFRAHRTHVFSTETPISLDSRIKSIAGVNDGVRKGHVIFQGEAAQLFQRHPVFGVTTGMKRWWYRELQTKGFGDLVIDAATRVDDTTLVITKAHVATAADPGGRFATGSGHLQQWSKQVFMVGSDVVTTPIFAVGGPVLSMVVVAVSADQAGLIDLNNSREVKVTDSADGGSDKPTQPSETGRTGT